MEGMEDILARFADLDGRWRREKPPKTEIEVAAKEFYTACGKGDETLVKDFLQRNGFNPSQKTRSGVSIKYHNN